MTPDTTRTGNKRGFGGNLREEILVAASRLLAQSGSRDAVTLRAIAREAKIAAPSIYPHFADRDSILDAVVTRTFETLAAACTDSVDATAGGHEQVDAICRAYVAFARERPGLYRILFERAPANIASPPHAYPAGIEAFGVLVRAVARASPAASGADHIMRDAQTLFAALHGIAVLPPALPGFPWQDETVLVTNAVAKLCPGSPGPGDPPGHHFEDGRPPGYAA